MTRKINLTTSSPALLGSKIFSAMASGTTVMSAITTMKPMKKGTFALNVSQPYFSASLIENLSLAIGISFYLRESLCASLNEVVAYLISVSMG